MRGTLNDQYRPPVKAPTPDAPKPRFWVWMDVWGTYSGPMTQAGAWTTWFNYFLTPLYNKGHRLFIVNLPWGVTSREKGGYEFDVVLYRTGTWVTEFLPAITAWRKAHPGCTMQVYMGSLHSLFVDGNGVPIDARVQANLDAAVKKIDQVLKYVAPFDSMAIDGSAGADPNLTIDKDPANGGMYAWFAGQIDRIRKQIPVTLEAMPLTPNTWAHSFGWVCNGPDFDVFKGNPNVEHRFFGSERIIIARPAVWSDPASVQPYMKGYVDQGFSVAWPHTFAYEFEAKLPIDGILGLFPK